MAPGLDREDAGMKDGKRSEAERRPDSQFGAPPAPRPEVGQVRDGPRELVHQAFKTQALLADILFDEAI